MKKRVTFLFMIMIIILSLAACSDEPNYPTEKMENFIQLWHEQNFEKMYELLTDEAKRTYSEEDFIDRYEKIYNDLEINDIAISYEDKSEIDLEMAIENKDIQYKIDVSLESIAGPIQFTNDLQLVLVEDEKEEDAEWLIDWNPGLIFPELKDGGKIRIVTEEPKRGEILDRNQMPLALNDIAYEIGVVPSKFQHKENEIEHIARLLNMSVAAIEEQLNASWVQDDHFVPLKVVAKSDEKTLNELLTIPAVSTAETTGRVYPAGEAAAHLTGYIGKITEEEIKNNKDYPYKESDLIGKRGLEQLYEKQLRGEPGVKIFIEKEQEDGSLEEIVLAEKPVKHGEHIQVNIDVNIQEKIFATFENRPGTAAAIHPKTGEIIALVSSPSFDPNEFVYGITQTKWNKLMEHEDEPFVNRFTATYAPGSVIKPISAIIGLNEGVIDPNEGIEIKGLTWGKDSWGDYEVRRVSSTGKPVDLRDALVYSDNIYFAMKAVELGHKKYTDGLKEFGFTEKLPMEYPFTISQISNEGHLQDEVLLANTSYGQGEIEVSSLHMALMYTPIINGGNLIKPSLLTTEPSGEVWKENILSEDHAKILQKHLRDVVTDGTAKIADIDEVKISGKTGTVELKLTQDSTGHQNGWFVGYPTDDKDIIIAMMMEKVENLGTSTLVAEKVTEVIKEMKED